MWLSGGKNDERRRSVTGSAPICSLGRLPTRPRVEGGSPLEFGKGILMGKAAESGRFPTEEFKDLLSANKSYAANFKGSQLSGSAARGLAIVTCMDSRINPLAVVGMHSGDAKILRNAGARVTEDVLRTLVLATYLLGVDRILVMPHTDCRMAQSSEADIHGTIFEQYGVDTRSLEFRTDRDQRKALETDLIRIRSYPLLRSGVVVAGAIYDVSTGVLEPLDY